MSHPWELERAIQDFVEDYDHRRYHEPLDNLTPEDVYTGREKEVLTRGKKIKQRILRTDASKIYPYDLHMFPRSLWIRKDPLSKL